MTHDKPKPLKRQPSKLSQKSSGSTKGQSNTNNDAKTKVRHPSTVSQPHINTTEEKKPSTGLGDWATVKGDKSWDPNAPSDGDPFQCRCSACQNFWKKNFGEENAELLAGGCANRSRSTGPMFYVKDLEVKVGDRVLVWRTHSGVVKFIGPLSDDLVSPHLFIGVKLDDNVNSLTNGVHNGKRYFHCPPGHGAFVKYKDIIVCEALDKVPPVDGNEMFPSHRKIVATRKQKREADPDYDLGQTQREKAAANPDLSQAFPTSRKVASDRVIYDSKDMAYQAYVRHINKPPPPPKAKVKLTDQEKRNLELKKEFGGGKRADKMVETVNKLRNAYNEGLMEVNSDQNGYD